MKNLRESHNKYKKLHNKSVSNKNKGKKLKL